MTTSGRITTASAIILAGVFVLWAPPANVQSSVECVASTDSIKACADEIFTAQIDLLDRVEGLINDTQSLRMYALGTQASQVDDDLLERIKALREERQRGKDANDGDEEADYDEMIAQANRQKGKKCKWEEVLEDDDDPEAFVPTGLKLDTAAIKRDIGDLKAGQAGADEVLEDIKSLVRQNQLLLLTPHGQRDGFPLK